MFIVPVITIKRPNTDLTQFWIFMERNGSHLIHLDATPETAFTAAKEFLTLNEMFIKGEPIIVGELVFVTIDSTLTDIQSFYTWREVPVGTIPAKEVWRSFLWFSTNNNIDPLGVNHFLKTISVAGLVHTVFSIMNSYLKTCE
jgi:hypothetical protein